VLNPKLCDNFLDSCAFDPKYSPESEASLEIFSLYESETILLSITHSNQKEIEHPNTPDWVKKQSQLLLYTIEVELTESERAQKSEIHRILTGNGLPEKMKQDSEHVFESAKYGGYFITTDERILRHRKTLAEVCLAKIVKPSEFLEIFHNT
jgi:hypothetical protein